MRIDKHITAQIIKGLLWPSAIAAIIIGILLAATLIQTKIHNPVIGSDFSSIYQHIEKNPSNQQDLKDEVRALDLLARKAYFTSIHQLKTGTIIFFTALAAVLILWNIHSTLSPPPPIHPKEKKSWWMRQTQSAKTAGIASVCVITAAIALGVIHKYAEVSAINSKLDTIVDNEEQTRWWMNFRGPQGIGVAYAKNIRTAFDGGSMAGIGWKVEVPLEGNSSPVVYDDKIFLTGGTKDKRQVYCFGVNDGKLLWTYNVDMAGHKDFKVPKVDKETGYAAPTAACDGKSIYAIFGTGELVALSLKGKLGWEKYLGVQDNHYGHASSLIAAGGLVFVQFDAYDSGKLFAFNGKSGKTVWEAARTVLSWGSPICVNTGSRRELILVDNESATSYDPASGKMLWSNSCLHGEVGPSAAFASGMVFTANEYATVSGIDLADIGDDGSPKLRWDARGDLPNTASPVSVDSLLFLAASNGIVTCIDNRSGETLWTHTFDTGFYSSPIIVNNNVFLFDRDGVMHVFAVSSEFLLIASSNLGEPVVTTPAVVDGYMIVRGEKYLYRIE